MEMEEMTTSYVFTNNSDTLPLTITNFYETNLEQLDETLNQHINDESAEWKLNPMLVLQIRRGEEERRIVHFCLKALPAKDVHIVKQLEKLEQRLQEYQQRGSGWSLSRVVRLEWLFVQYNSLSTHTGHGRLQTLPTALANKKAVINVTDAPENECFKYAVLSALHHSHVRHKQRASSYRTWENDIRFHGITFPFTLGVSLLTILYYCCNN